ncbi:acidic fibroblast growth factor binding-domain-containing protein [Cladochytrium replicatum]|nr:acidic fibroblast growth factor binding-domain-containing protein [Cladochytrium replicatum]
MSPERSAFVSDAQVLDRSVYQLWLLGLNVEQAVFYAQRKLADRQSSDPTTAPDPTSQTNAPHTRSQSISATPNPPTTNPASTSPHTSQSQLTTIAPPPPLIRALITSQYRNFELLEHYLHRPRHLQTQLIFPLASETQRFLIETYYSFDERVMRDLLGKRLTSRARKELEEVAEKTKIPLAGCRRMFDNLKRIMKRVEDSEGNALQVIRNDFLLNKKMASQYANVIFICTYRLDTSKKKLSNLKFADFCDVAQIFRQHFSVQPASPTTNNTNTNSTSSTPTTPQNLPLPVQSLSIGEEVDLGLAQDSRDIRTLLFNSKDVMDDYRGIVTRRIAGASASAIEKGGDKAFKLVLRNVLGIGAGLGNNRDLRDIFVNLIEKIVEPCVGMGWTASDLETFLNAVVQSYGEVNAISVSVRKRYTNSLSRLLTGIILAASRLYEIPQKT